MQKMSLIITDMSSDVKQKLSSSSTNASILSILVEIHYNAPAKLTGQGHIVAATYPHSLL